MRIIIYAPTYLIIGYCVSHGRKKVNMTMPKSVKLTDHMQSMRSQLGIRHNTVKIDKTKVLTTTCSSMKVESIAECSLVTLCITSDLH